MRRRLFWFACLCALALMLGYRARMTLERRSRKAKSSAEATLLRAKEYAVYDALLQSGVLGGAKKTDLFVIGDKTSVRISDLLDADQLARIAKAAHRRLDRRLVQDFIDKNGKEYQLERRFRVRREYVLVSDEEVRKLRSGEEREEFYIRSRNPVGKVCLSRMGFNSRRDEALMHVDNIRGELNASGFLALLKKEFWKWRVEWKVGAWVS